jgi:uncharacterized phage-associated protein
MIWLASIIKACSFWPMKEGQFDSRLSAKYLLALAHGQGIILNVTKVQKLLYIAYGAILAEHGYSFMDEKAHAWPYGPVFPKTRKPEFFEKIHTEDDAEFEGIRQDAVVKATFLKVIERYAKFTAQKLSEWSHDDGGPWHQTTQLSGFKWNDVIPDELIKNYFLRYHA